MGLLTENKADIFPKGIPTNQVTQPFNQKANRHLFCAKKFQLFAALYERKPFNNLFLMGNFYLAICLTLY